MKTLNHYKSTRSKCLWLWRTCRAPLSSLSCATLAAWACLVTMWLRNDSVRGYYLPSGPQTDARVSHAGQLKPNYIHTIRSEPAWCLRAAPTHCNMLSQPDVSAWACTHTHTHSHTHIHTYTQRPRCPSILSLQAKDSLLLDKSCI